VREKDKFRSSISEKDIIIYKILESSNFRILMFFHKFCHEKIYLTPFYLYRMTKHQKFESEKHVNF